jgi:hypothetical protein
MTIGATDAPAMSGRPALQIARRVRSQHRFSFDGQDNDVVRLPRGAVTRLIQQLADMARSSVQQIALAPRTEATDAFADAVWRSLADDDRRGVDVKCLYLLPSGRADVESGAGSRYEVRKLPLQQLIEEPAALPVNNVWLIDGATVVSQDPQGSPHWQVSTRPADVVRFRETWNRLWSRAASPIVSPSGRIDLAEQLVRTADTMATIAPMSCSRPTYGQASCAWYHGAWQHLRLFNMVSSPDWHSPFYERSFDSLFQGFNGTEQPNVLIPGTADYTLLAYVMHASAKAGTDARITVVDRCRTPLLACQWYSQRLSGQEARGTADLDVHESDVLDVPVKDRRYDVITTDGFLTRLEAQSAEEVVRAWHGQLAPGGTVITTVRIHPLDAPRGSMLDEVSDFALRARDRALRWRRYLKSQVNEITTAAQQYAVSMRSQDLGDVPKVLGMFTSAGFEIEDHSLQSVPGELRPATYLQIVARRPSD